MSPSHTLSDVFIKDFSDTRDINVNYDFFEELKGTRNIIKVLLRDTIIYRTFIKQEPSTDRMYLNGYTHLLQ